MAGPEKTSGKEELASRNSDDTKVSDQMLEENDEHINVEGSADVDNTMEEGREQHESLKTDLLSVDVNQHDRDETENISEQNQPQLTTNSTSEIVDVENDIDVASIEEPAQLEDPETRLGVGGEASEIGETGQLDLEGHAVELEAQSELNDRLMKLPLTRIKHIIKMDPDVTLASQEAVVTIAKATELFIGTLSRDACYKTLQGRRRVVLRKDLEHTMDTRDCYAFLEGAVDS